jgi:hypothetical protein
VSSIIEQRLFLDHDFTRRISSIAVIFTVILILKDDEIMLLKHRPLADVIFDNARCGTIIQKESIWINNRRQAVRQPVEPCVISQSSTKAGGLARSCLLEHRDDGIYMAYAFALRRHEAHRQYGINTVSPI